MKALIVKQPWIDYILDGTKTWEIRGCKTNVRGKIELIQSGSGFVIGSVEIVDCKRLTIEEFRSASEKHQIFDNLDCLPYKNTYAWIVQNPIRYNKPRPYKHPHGAIIWVKLEEK